MEGQELRFTIHTLSDTVPYFSLEGAEGTDMHLDTVGNFYWRPPYDLVDRVTQTRKYSVIFQASWRDRDRSSRVVDFVVHHCNRPPEVEDLPVFYVRMGTKNTYQVPGDFVNDPDGDPITFKPMASTMPEGSALSGQGVFSWTPSRNQFLSLKNTPLVIQFAVEDLPARTQTVGRLKVMQTQLDLPPEILIVPGDTTYRLKEDETINFRIYVSDPNGDEDLRECSFVASDPRVPGGAWKRHTPQQYEFTWMPGYEFVEEVDSVRNVDLIFFALDVANNRAQRSVHVNVLDTENMEERDALQYQKYRNNLIAAMQLIEILDENQKKLNTDYKKARKGKQKRSILNASLGAATGFTPVILQDSPGDAKIVSALGGTTVLTLNTLEATEVIGKSKDAIMDRLKINIDIRNKVQSAGDEFARKYALRSARRSPEFEKDIDKLRTVINDQHIVLLELSAYRKNSEPSNKEIRNVFLDFSDEF